MEKFVVLKGLPPYGPVAESFPKGQMLATEGLVVQFLPDQDLSWVGNFRRGHFNCDAVFEHPDGKQVVVCASGNVFFVDPYVKTVTGELAPDIIFAVSLPDQHAIVFGDFTKFFAINAAGLWWETPHIWGDGFRNIRVSNRSLVGEAFSPLNDKWHPFEVDLQTGAFKGITSEDQISNMYEVTKKDKG